MPRARAAVATGFAIAIPPGYEVQVRPRSGLALKHGVTCLNTPGTIDSDYRGEVKVILANLGAEPFVITRGDRIAQLVPASVQRAVLDEVEALDDTTRGTGGSGRRDDDRSLTPSSGGRAGTCAGAAGRLGDAHADALYRRATSHPRAERLCRQRDRRRRCAVPKPGDGHYVVRVDVAALVGSDGTVRRAVPHAISCPTVEQYAAGLVTGFARGNLQLRAGASDAWYRATIVFDWR